MKFEYWRSRNKKGNGKVLQDSTPESIRELILPEGAELVCTIGDFKKFSDLNKALKTLLKFSSKITLN